MRPQVIVIAGVAGCGKTTVGEMLARGLGWDFADADDYHSDEHQARMRDGTGLTDEDRIPWLDRLAGLISETVAGERLMVLACSALSRAHRSALRVDPCVEIFLIHVPEEEIIRRLQGRTGHFFNPALASSQFEALEMPSDEEPTTVIDGNRPVGEIVEDILGRLPSGPLGAPPSASW
jgi:carbohydrate kinase (thermoresistant glucokinase family)